MSFEFRDLTVSIDGLDFCPTASATDCGEATARTFFACVVASCEASKPTGGLDADEGGASDLEALREQLRLAVS